MFEPPKFTGRIMNKIDLLASKFANYTLPIIQNNSDEYVIHNPSLPRFVTF